MKKQLVQSPLEETIIDDIVSAFKKIGWSKPRVIYETYLKEQSERIRSVIIVKEAEQFCAYVTLKWKSDYPSFNQQDIPEISDLNVLPSFRRQGIGASLIKACEAMAKERGYKNIGLGVGMTADYGPAQRLYVQLGYVPDGQGLHYKNKPLSYGEQATVDDDLVVYLIKALG